MTKESTLILGNGFDLNLGLHTSYRDFVDSKYWPINNMKFSSQLAQYLADRSKYERWFDLELALARYAAPGDARAAAISALTKSYSIDQQVFEKLREGLSQYISFAEAAPVPLDSLAACLMKHTFSKYRVDNIFSFNYTDLNALVNRCGGSNVDYHHVHGNCRDDSVILGISDEEKIKEGYEFLYKTCSPYYQSTNVRYALQRSSLVIFFGHSLGPQDYHYFSNFFHQQSRVDMKEEDAKSIIIIVYDDASRMDILKQLRRMNEGRINLLFDCNKMRIFKTAEDDTDQILEYINNELNSVQKYKAQVNAQMWLEHANDLRHKT